MVEEKKDEATKKQTAARTAKKLIERLKQAHTVEARQALISELKSFLSSNREDVPANIESSLESAIVEAELKENEEAMAAEIIAEREHAKENHQPLSSCKEPEPIKSHRTKPELEKKPIEKKLEKKEKQKEKPLEQIKPLEAAKPIVLAEPKIRKNLITKEEEAIYGQFFKKVPALVKRMRRKSSEAPKPPSQIPKPPSMPNPSAPPADLQETLFPPPKKSRVSFAPLIARGFAPKPPSTPRDSAPKPLEIKRLEPEPLAPPAERQEALLPPAKKSRVSFAPLIARGFAPKPPSTPRDSAPKPLEIKRLEPEPNLDVEKAVDQIRGVLQPTEKKVRKSFAPVMIKPTKSRRVSESSLVKPKVEEKPLEPQESQTSAESIKESLTPKSASQIQPSPRQVVTDAEITHNPETSLEATKAMTASLKDHQVETVERVSHAPTRPRRRSV